MQHHHEQQHDERLLRRQRQHQADQERDVNNLSRNALLVQEDNQKKQSASKGKNIPLKQLFGKNHQSKIGVKTSNTRVKAS